jgi:hypothetical protein
MSSATEYIILCWIARKAIIALSNVLIGYGYKSYANCFILYRRSLITKREYEMFRTLSFLVSRGARIHKKNLCKDITKEYAYKCIEYYIENYDEENIKGNEEGWRSFLHGCVDIVQDCYGSEKYVFN